MSPPTRTRKKQPSSGNTRSLRHIPLIRPPSPPPLLHFPPTMRSWILVCALLCCYAPIRNVLADPVEVVLQKFRLSSPSGCTPAATDAIISAYALVQNTFVPLPLGTPDIQGVTAYITDVSGQATPLASCTLSSVGLNGYVSCPLVAVGGAVLDFVGTDYFVGFVGFSNSEP